MNELMNFIVMFATNRRKLQDSRNDIYIAMPLKLTMALYLRFMQSSLDSFTSSVILNVLVAVIEMASRLSYLCRVELFERFVLGKSKEEIFIKFSSIIYKRHIGRKIILDMIIENVCIAIAPLIVMLHWHNGLIIQAGYDDMTYNGWLMFHITMVSFLAEIITDAICWRYEDPRVNLRDAWSHLIAEGRYWGSFLPTLLFSVLFATSAMLFGFAKFQSSFTSEPCY